MTYTEKSAKNTLTSAFASKYAQLVLGHSTQEYPNHIMHVLNHADDAQTPRALHPIFYGSYDWHSCIHGYWLLTRLLSRFPDLPETQAIHALFNTQLTADNVKGEIAYLNAPGRRLFSRPYGWGWLLALQTELLRLDTEDGRRWAATMQPLADVIVERFKEFLPKATYPVRVGTHFNTAFALSMALKYAREINHAELEQLCCAAAKRWHLDDAGCQAWEPSGDEFLSPALIVAELMQLVLPAAEFNTWFTQFLPNLEQQQPATLFIPAIVTDHSDGKIAHLNGLNLSRAWCQRSIARALPSGDPRVAVLLAAADHHLDTALGYVVGDYMGEHWLGTFAVLALEA